MTTNRTEALEAALQFYANPKNWGTYLVSDKRRFTKATDDKGSIARKALALTDPAPSGEELARKFHDTYERLAPSFGYETRQDTKQFDPASANGRLMIAVYTELADALRQPAHPLDEVERVALEHEIAAYVRNWNGSTRDGNTFYIADAIENGGYRAALKGAP